MLPPTGLTFIVHAVIVLVQKVFRLFRPLGGNIKSSKNPKLQTTASVAIIALVVAYTFWLVILFVERGIHDRYSNWNVADRTVSAVRKSFNDDEVLTPQITKAADIWNIDSTQSVTPEPYPSPVNLLITSKYFTDTASPYIVQYAEDFKVIYQFVPILFNKI